METYLKLDNGLHTDFEPINQPDGTYRYMLNAVRQLSGAIENEAGTLLLKQFVGNGTRVLGSYVLDNDVIICSYNPTTNLSEIGVLDNNDIYSVIISRADLAFSLGSIIKMEGKKNFKSERIIYLVEKNGSNPMRCINLDDKNLLASTTFIDDIKLQINPSTPNITVDSVVDGGSLPTGIYQATARLLTRSTNSTPFGIVSPIVPIIDDSSTLPIDQQDGANPQSVSPKAINFIIDSIDTSYSFIEVAIITYTGIANVSKVNLVARLPIDGRTTINFTYSTTDQNKEVIDLEAIAIKPVIYDRASSITQKDGILTLGNLEASQEDYDFQLVANLIKMKYFIDEVPYTPGYKDPILSATKKGYQRDEIYSFALVPEFTGQFNSTAYHIPGNITNPTASTTLKLLGNYISNEEYPKGSNYPLTRNIYHHRMPSISQEPLLVVKNGILHIRILGVEPDFSEAAKIIPANILKKVKGFSIVRQIRKDGDKSILAQGIANTHFKQSNVNFRFLSALPKYLASNTHFFSRSQPIPNEIGFYSPETVIYQSNIVGNLLLRPVAQLDGTQRIVNDLRTHKNDNDVAANFKLMLDYDRQSPIAVTDTVILPNSPQYVQADSADTVDGSNVLITGTNDTVNIFKNNGYLYLKLANLLPVKQVPYNASDGTYNNIPEFYYNYRGHDATDRIYLRGTEQGVGGATGSSPADRYLYNIVRQLPSQYGAIYDATYIYCGSISKNVAGSYVGRVYGGDTFIGKFGVVNTGGVIGGEDEVNYKVLNYYYCESTINVGYRHYSNPVGTEGQANFIAGTTPYYPKLEVLYNDPNDKALTPGILNLSWALGHGRGYNKQYSFENSVIIYYPKQLAEEKVTKYSNRVIYSEQSVEGEQVDSYRIFLPNNYHDVPKDKGEITELFVHNHRYYIHTSGALYLASFNDRVSQATSIGDVYLGNGGVFNRPSEPILTLSGGYAGTTSSASINTPYGRMFIDNLNSKIYLLADSLKEISEQGMFKYFSKEILDIADTPSTNSGYCATYDQVNHRLLLTRVGAWTLSYSPQLNSWSSYHSYLPYHYITKGQKLYSVNANELYSNNTGSYGIYYGQLPAPMQVDIVVNDNPNVTKTFDNLVFYTTSIRNGIEQHYDTWNTLQCYNNRQNTGKCRLIVPRNYQEDFQTLGLYECFAKLKSNEFRVAIPNDLVIDVNQSIFVANNLSTSRAYRPAISGKWIIASLVYNNLRDNKFVLHTMGRIFRQRIR